jgi:hypothetical protein
MTSQRIIALIGGAILEFAAVVAVLLALTPEPRAKVDYLVIGTLATFASLATVFALVMLTKKKPTTPKQDPDEID